LTDANATGKPTIGAFPAADNYPAVEGLITNFVFCKHHLLQMKMHTSMNAQSAVDILLAIHRRAKHLRMKEGSYYAVLYTTATIDWARVNIQVPEGSFVVGPRAIERLLQPFGLTPVLQQIQKKKKKRG
jgi:hypothetical protein